MILAVLLLLSGLTISGVAIYYSVMGLMAIFSAAAIPIAIMGISLEVGKLVTASWVKAHWPRLPILMKTYAVTAVAILMFITSLGIFGFLSKAHSDQTLVSGDVQSKIAIYDEKIKTEKENIEADRRALKQMDEGVDQVLGRSTDEKGADKAVALRKSQQKERVRLQNEISQSQKSIAELTDARAPIAAEVRKVEAEVGPIKYIAAFVYGDNPDASILERAVTWVIILIVIVFDPLAVVMLLASQMTFAWIREEQEPQEVEHDSWVAEVGEPPTAEEKAEIEDPSQQMDVVDIKAAQAASEEEYPVEPEPFSDPHPPGWMFNEPVKPEPEKSVFEKHPYLDRPWTGLGTEVKPLVYTPEEPVVEPPLVVTNSQPEDNVPLMSAELTKEEQAAVDDMLDSNIEKPNQIAEKNVSQLPFLTALADNEMHQQISAGFGTAFPISPAKGDMYLRVDYLPPRLFKWNKVKWVEVDRNNSDSYAYNEAYIPWLIEQLAAGKYDADLLTDVEHDQIEAYLAKVKHDQ